VSSGGSRKKKQKDPNSTGIKVRTPKDKTKTVRKNHVLRFIRAQQDKNYKKLLEGDKSIKEPEILDESFNSDFDESLKYLMSLAEETDKNAHVKNQTLRNYPNRNVPESLFSLEPNENVSLVMPEDLQNWSASASTAMQLASPRHRYPQPSYGCLKNGNLPTYRTYHNRTQRAAPVQRSFASPVIDGYLPELSSQSGVIPAPINPALMKSEIKQTMDLMNASPNKRMKFPKQRRTIRRTFKLGKSKRYPTISVLVSNKTLRNQISTKSHLLKQTPIDDVRRFLVKKGFIKVGSSAPNDVLRKMYESASMVCGEIQNHNPDNLLYNFLNGAGINA
jgi:hypothetical protein